MDNKPGLHPLVTAAAISIILLSGVGIAFMTGILPHARTAETLPATAGVTEPADINTAAATPVPVETLAASTGNTEKTEAAGETATPPRKPVAHHTAHRAVARNEERSAPAERQAPAPVCYDCGTVVSVNPVTVQGSASGLGAVGGAVAGGVVGHQIGGGKGRDALTVLGALGGALAGNQIEKSRRQTTRYDVTVRMEDGSNRTFSYDTVPAVSSGDHVRVSNGELQRN
ncbi:MAG: glycine zipper 2TM domain-containing protein [bacterium]|nr:glycine zipper 2TM domain-containing protein [bacterium]